LFARLGTFTSRFRWPLIAGWLLLALVVTLVAPNIDRVAVNDQRAFLARDAPSLTAFEMVQRHFPEQVAPSSTVVVVDAGEGRRADEGAAQAFMADITEWMRQNADLQVVESIISPSGADEDTARSLISPDGQLALLIVRFSAIGTEETTQDDIQAIRERVAGTAPEGVETYLTGDASVIAAYDEATRRSLNSITWITIFLVVIILLFVYRSPISPLIPLVTIALAYLVSRGFVAFLGDNYMTISGYTNIFLIVVLFGAGTDYCLFLISRFREEMARSRPGTATRETLRSVGQVISSSAAAVIVGLATLGLAELGLFNTMGPSVAIGVFIALAAGLTFAPALLSLLGDRAFWPRRAGSLEGGPIWRAWTGTLAAHPRAALIVTLLLLIPVAIYGYGQERDFDLLHDLPADMEARQGFETLSEHMGAGTMQPLTLLLGDEERFDTAEGLERLELIEERVERVEHVAGVRGFVSSLQESETLSVEDQLEDQLTGLREGISQMQTAAVRSVLRGRPIDPQLLQQSAAGLQSLFAYLQQLGTEHPEAAREPGYQQAMQALMTLASSTGMPLPGAPAPESPPTGGIPREVVPALQELEQGMTALRESYRDRPDAVMLPRIYLESNEQLASLRDSYFAGGGDVTRMQVTLEVGPYSPEALTAVNDLRELASATADEGYVEGSSAVVADLASASSRDMTRAVVWVLLGMLVVLVFILRALVAPIYLILTILVSYGATMGALRLVFTDILGAPGLTWWVPIFTFVMLVALGMDYSIFLMGRVKEETAGGDPARGIHLAVSRTGGIIISAALITAGAFAAMMSASILGLVQIGFAVAFGVLLDTLVVRTALVPSLAVLLGRWSWWPRRPGSY
jgi:putative drug exporter of the RND superfamily